MDFDSDRTVDSDELEEIISKAKKKPSSNAGKKRNTHFSLHNISDSDSDSQSPSKKIKKKECDNAEFQKKPVCKYGSKCYRKNPDHKREFYHPSKIFGYFCIGFILSLIGF